MRYKNIGLLALCIVLCILGGLIGSFFTSSAIPTWYAGLNKPSFNPPNYLFGPVWTVLYIMMGISLYLVWSNAELNRGVATETETNKEARASNVANAKKEAKSKTTSKNIEKKPVKIALLLFFVQLILNTLWSIIFFGFKMPGVAFFEIILLWFSILATIIIFYKISKPAAYLLIPYILWVSFAAVLNLFIWILN